MSHLDVPENIIHASFFFTDIVGLSDPTLSTDSQTSKIKALNQSITKCNTFRNTSEKEKIVLPTGDGMLIGFFNGLEKPLKLAKELQEEIKQYNNDKLQNEQVLIRIGCHSGEVFAMDDLQGNRNIWGPGTILARRVMDAGDAGHILMTSSMAERLMELSDEYRKIIHPLHDYKIKHGSVLLIYSVYDNTFGNPNKPLRGIMEKTYALSEIRRAVWFHDLKMRINIKDDKTNFAKIMRTYQFSNTLDEPIDKVANGITTDIQKSFDKLHVKAYDENEKELEIDGISVDTEYRKEFTLKLNEPVLKGDKNRKYTIVYEVEHPHRFFEHLFLINTENLSVNFNFPTNGSISEPKLYLIASKDREKTLIPMKPDSKKGVVTQVEWKIPSGVMEKDLVRLEW